MRTFLSKLMTVIIIVVAVIAVLVIVPNVLEWKNGTKANASNTQILLGNQPFSVVAKNGGTVLLVDKNGQSRSFLVEYDRPSKTYIMVEY